jgi:CrcB protein
MLAYITLGGILGTLARYVLQGWIQARSGLATFPVGTLAINLAGSFAIGFIIRLATGSTVITPEVRAGLTIGFCGAFTTMSTFSYESMRLLADAEYWAAGLYMGGTVAGCLGAVIAGTALASKLL